LIDARSDRHLWNNRYDRELSDVLALQSDVARAVAEQIRLKLTAEEQVALTASRTVDPQAYDAYLRGLQLRGPGALAATWVPPAIEHFEKAVGIDPDFAEAWAALAWVRAELGISGYLLGHRGELPRAREAAQRALDIDERLGAAHSTVGSVRLWYEWDFTGARRAFVRALQLSPSDPAVLENYAWYLLAVEEKTEEMFDLSERLLRVAPFDLFFRAARINLFFGARHFESALAEIERVREVAPDYVDINVSQIYLALGRQEDAFREELAYQQKCGVPCRWEAEALRRGWEEGGWEGAWRAWLEEATKVEAYSPWLIARRYTMIGETDKAFAWLERSYRDRNPWLILTKRDPVFDPLRSDPRFEDLLRRIGFPEDSRKK
jgi:tetratricopeptide (TPR) repeat protein